MKRLSIVLWVISLLILGDGIYQVASNYKPESENQVWSSSIELSDGETLIISAVVLALIAAGMWWYARREEGRRSAQRSVHARSTDGASSAGPTDRAPTARGDR